MLNKLMIRDWKSFEEADLSFKKGTNVIYGENFSGKTSILDAIAFALFGSLPDPNLPLHYMIRSGCKIATVEAEFTINGEEFLVRRTVSGKKRTVVSAHLYNAAGVELEGEASRVNERISSLFQHSEDYFFRTIYMPEGSIYAFLTKPPKTGVREEIDNALGITTITQLVKIVKKLRGDADRDLKNLERKERNSTKTEVSEKQMEEWMKEKSEIEETLHELNVLHDKARQLDLANRDIKQRQDKLDTLHQGVPGTGRTLSRIDEAIAESESNRDRKEKQNEKKVNQLASIQAIEKSEEQHLEILEKAKKMGEAKCPVCESDLSGTRVNELIKSRKEKLDELTNNKLLIEKELNALKTEIKGIRDTLKDWLNRRGEIKNHFEELKRLVKVQKELKSALGKQKKTEIENQIKEKEKRQKELEGCIQKAKIIGDLIESDLKERIHHFAHVVYLTKDFQAALEITAQEFRDTRLVNIREEARETWTSLVDGGPWNFDWDNQFIPFVTVGEKEFHTRQLSGAEKLFILFSLRTAFAKTLGNPGFLLFDEPAEHLDPGNQRRVVTALQKITKEVKQVIIASCKPVVAEAKWDNRFEITKTSGVSLVNVG